MSLVKRRARRTNTVEEIIWFYRVNMRILNSAGNSWVQEPVKNCSARIFACFCFILRLLSVPFASLVHIEGSDIMEELESKQTLGEMLFGCFAEPENREYHEKVFREPIYGEKEKTPGMSMTNNRETHCSKNKYFETTGGCSCSSPAATSTKVVKTEWIRFIGSLGPENFKNRKSWWCFPFREAAIEWYFILA
jgi:hypothetical protein